MTDISRRGFLRGMAVAMAGAMAGAMASAIAVAMPRKTPKSGMELMQKAIGQAHKEAMQRLWSRQVEDALFCSGEQWPPGVLKDALRYGTSALEINQIKRQDTDDIAVHIQHIPRKDWFPDG